MISLFLEKQVELMPQNLQDTLDIELHKADRNSRIEKIMNCLKKEGVSDFERTLTLDAWEKLTDRQLKISEFVFWNARQA